MSAPYHTLLLNVYRLAESNRVEISHHDPASQAQIEPVRGTTAIDPTALLELLAEPARYGATLTQQLFSDPKIRERFSQIDTAAVATSSYLRFSLAIEASAQDLSALRWELLRHPVNGTPLATSENILFSRYMSSRDHRPVKLRPRTDLSALVAVSAPPAEGLRKMSLMPVDFTGEVTRATSALTGVRQRTLGGQHGPVTLDLLIDAMRSGVDIVYLVAHGAFGRRTQSPVLVLQENTGEAALVKGDDLADRIAELQQRPRLVVLASCQSAGDLEQSDAGTVAAQATLAGRLADAGVPAVVAMLGQISMRTIERMMPVFFAELLKDGQIDRALAVARGKVRDRADAWMVALYTRLTAGCLWYDVGFRGSAGPDDVWKLLVPWVRRGKVVPILGPRVLEAAHGDSHETALRMAGARRFPLGKHDWDDLPRVTQFVTSVESRMNAIDAYKAQLLANLVEQHKDWLPPSELPPVNKNPMLGKLLAMVGDRLRKNPTDPHKILAELPARVYVTTNHDTLLKKALQENRREPRQVLTGWRFGRSPDTTSSGALAEPSYESPLIYHVFGALGQKTDEGLVLTEDDYFDYLIHAASAKLLTQTVESALVDNSLLFLGFRLTDWHFRVLFRLMMNLPGKEKLAQYCHVAVQLDPDMQSMADTEGAKRYLSTYFGKAANIHIYWGTVEEFLKRLHGAVVAAGGPIAEVPVSAEDEDAWT